MGVFSDLKPTNTTPRNGFDLSRRSVFSVKNGQILPVFVQHTLPNSDYRIDVNQLLRTQPLQRAAFTGFSINYDFAFVPFNQLYTSFNQFIGQRADQFLANQPSFTDIPLFPILRIVYNYRVSIAYDFIVSRLSGDYTEEVRRNVGTENFNFPYRTLVSNFSSTSVWIDFVRSLDMFGYCNLLPFFKMVADNFFDSHPNLVSWNDLFNTFDSVPSSLKDDIVLAFTISQVGYDLDLTNLLADDKYNIFAPMAYQKMFYEFYRNKYYDNALNLTLYLISDPGRTTFPFSYNQIFNFDDYVKNTSGSYTDRELLRIVAMFTLHKHTYRKDLFTGVLPSMQFGNVSMQLANAVQDGVQSRYILDAKLADQTSTIDQVRVNQQGVLYAENLIGSSEGSRVNFALSPNIAISVLESRRADAMQRFRERMLRAGDSTKDIFKAHGWESPKSEQFHEPIFLGSFDGRLDINTVAATTGNGEDQELGQLAANGVGVVAGSEIRFHSSDFGVIIGVMYIIKDSEYNSFGTDRQFCLTEPFDFPYPELQNISLSPIVNRQLNGLYLSNPVRNGEPVQGGLVMRNPNDILGYLPAFMEYKTAVDKVHGEFCAGQYMTQARPAGLNKYFGTPILFAGVFSDWVTPRADILSPDSIAFLYQQIDIVDNVFVQAQTDNQDTDPFLVNAYFKCLAIEPLSVIGLPI